MSNQRPLEADVLPGLKRTLSTDFTKDNKAKQGESKITPCIHVLETGRETDHWNTQMQTIFDKENGFVKHTLLYIEGWRR